jgi:SAM-dependent methyltransferase
MNLTEAPELKELVTFMPNRREAVHNWYWYKEGFSRAFVDRMLDLFQAKNDSIILDPFCGVGTACLACKQRGLQSIGFDVNPLSLLAARAKTADYDLAELAAAVKDAVQWRLEIPKEMPQDEYLRRAFSKENLGLIFAYKERVESIGDPKIRDLFLLALIDATAKGSWAVKDGALLRIERRPVPYVNRLFKYKIRKMLHDLRKRPLPPAPVRIAPCDARSLVLDKESVDFVITSPPYLNKEEFSRAYKLELSLFFGQQPGRLAAFLGAEQEASYWADVRKVLFELFRVARPGAKVAWVVGGGCFPDRVVETDVRTAELAEAVGFSATDILVARHSWCTARRTIKVGPLRESAVMLEKP